MNTLRDIRFPITTTIKVRKNDSLLDYLLIPKSDGYFITAANCYGVPNGQMMFWSDDEINANFKQVII